MAMQRTVFSPRCCATSSTRREPLLIVSSALRIAGSSPSNDTSTTAPITWVTRPVEFAALAICRRPRFNSLFAADAAGWGQSASAPEMISISSLVMIAWRVRL